MTDQIIIPDDDLRIGKELERKYLDTLADLAADFENGRISASEFNIAWTAVYKTISGLLDWDMVNEMQDEFKRFIKPILASRAATPRRPGMGTSGGVAKYGGRSAGKTASRKAGKAP